MSRSLTLFITILIFSLGVFAQATGTLTGTVKPANEDSVLHDASVKIVELNKATTTDDSGIYKFSNVPPGTYTITVHQEGFSNSSKKVTVGSAALVTADFELTLAGLKEDVTVSGSGSEQSTFESIATVSTL